MDKRGAEKEKAGRGVGTPPAEKDVMKRQGRGRIASDILGSYTGTPEKGTVPEQDPDDL